jgi:molecular chaperone GrpE (heat shock protein)
MDREEILRRFEARLDAALGTEDAPRGIPEELLAGGETGAEDAPVDSTVDRYRMWAAITAVTQEVKLQGRTFKELSKQLSETLGRDNEARSRKEVLDGLLELRERLLRGVEAAGAREKVPPVFWDRLFRRRWEQIRHALEVVDAMAQGYALSLKSLDDLLARFEVRPIECKGEAFDPRLMSAVDVEETLDAAEGTVVAVYRTGYELNGAVYRTAQVRVARRPRRVATDE